MKERDLIVVGGGGFGREVLWLASETREPFRVRGVLDDGLAGKEIPESGAPLLGGLDRWVDHADCSFVIAVGSPRTRRTIAERMSREGTPRFATLIHRSVEMSGTVSVGAGSILCARTVVTVNVTLGEHSLLNLGVTVGHDCTLGRYCTVAPMVAVSGCVRVGDGVEVGTAAAIREGMSLGTGSMVAMGAVVVKDVEANTLVMGNPAQPKRALESF